MNVSQLKTFVAVVERGSFSEAARTLGISQPAVTMQIQALEAALGSTLLDRRYRRVDLTEAGRALMPHARRVLEQIDAAKDEIAALSGELTGRLTIAASTTPGVYLVPRVLGVFLAENPSVDITITVHDTAEVVDAVEAGRAHLGITGAVVRGSRVHFDEVGRDDLILICPANSPLAGGNTRSMASLAKETWIMREVGSGTRQVAEQLLGDAGVDPAELHVGVELGTGEAIVSAVEGGLGIAILSRYVAAKALELGTVSEVKVTGMPAARPLFAVLPKGTPARAAEAFLDHLKASL